MSTSRLGGHSFTLKTIMGSYGIEYSLYYIEDVARRAREAGKVGRTIHLSIGYSKEVFGGGSSSYHSKYVENPNNEPFS